MRSDYKICPLCGAVLDIGERCDCLDHKYKSSREYNAPGEYKSPLGISTQGSSYTPGADTPVKIPGHPIGRLKEAAMSI